MNKHSLPAIPDENRIEELLTKIHPVPGEQFHKKMEQAAWRVARRGSGGSIKNSFRAKAAFVMLMLVLIAALVATPQVRAWAQNFLGFFATSNSNTVSTTAVVDATAVQTAILPVEIVPTASLEAPGRCPESSDYLCQLLAAEEALGFEIRVFSSPVVRQVLKSDLTFMSLTADPSTQQTSVLFSTPDGLEIWLTQGLGDFPAPNRPWEIVPQSAVQITQVGTFPAEYLPGDFIQMPGSDEMVWEPSIAGIQRLRWKEGNRWFELRSMGRSRESSVPVQKADLLKLAESLTTYAQSPDLLAGSSSPSLEQRAGFDIKEPTILPKGFQLCYAGYDAGYDGPTVFLSYCHNSGTSLVIDQILIANASPYDFAERWGEDITVTPVQIGSVSGSYAVREDGIQVVMWEADGVRTEVVYQWSIYTDEGWRIDKAGMLSIVESMK